MMGISKGLRFQIMRRDGYACTYCGARPPDAVLVIDHVMPVALGGSDDPTNLTTACRDCNGGKAATPADTAVVDQVAESNREFRRIMADLADEADADDDVAWFLAEWKGDSDELLIPLPDGWQRSVRIWLERGLSKEDVQFVMNRAMGNVMVAHEDVFRYMAGVLWNTLTEREEQASGHLHKKDN